MLKFLLALSLAAGPVRTLGTAGLTNSNVDPRVAESFLEHFAQQLVAHGGFEVTTPQQVRALLGLERQKALVGCSDDSCSAEIANALGVDALITGTMTKTSSGYLVNMRVSSVKGAGTLAVFTARPKTDEEVLDFLEGAAKTFSATYGRDNKREVLIATEPAPPNGSRVLPWVVGGAAVAAAGTGVAFLLVAQDASSQLRAGGDAATVSSPEALAKLRSSGQTQELVGYVLTGAGAALAVTAVGLAVFGGASGSTAPAVSLVPLRGGGSVVFGGSF